MRSILKTAGFLKILTSPDLARCGMADKEIPNGNQPAAPAHSSEDPQSSQTVAARRKEMGGPKGPEPTRYGDWERNGKCVDF